MFKFNPYYTNDGSVGLYSDDFKDIFHSASGALTEAYEKFIYPIDFDILLKNDNINILDICYGIGYNTKSFLNFIYKNKNKLIKRKKILKKNYNKNMHIDTIYTNKQNIINKKHNELIYTDKIIKPESYTSIEKIYTDNIFNKVSVTAIDNNEVLFGLSPFIKSGQKKIVKNNQLISEHHLDKYYTNNKSHHYKIEKFINFLIFQRIIDSKPKIYENRELLSILFNKNFAPYLEGNYNLFKNLAGIFYNTESKLSNLHNIYYRYLSFCYKRKVKSLKIGDFIFEPKITDARLHVLEDKSSYNLIFLDAFTPKLCPCLWSYEFFKELYRLLSDDGILITYSSSASVRSAMIEAGFCIGYNYNKRLNKFDGTIAAKNKDLIKYQLSEFDFGLLKTTAGIFYRDENLSASNEAIIETRNKDVSNSNRTSSTKYIKSCKK